MAVDEVHTEFLFSYGTFHAAAGTWRGPFLRPLWDDLLAKHSGLWIVYVRSQLPVVEATLTIAAVTKPSVIVDQGIGRYTFNEVSGCH